MDSVNNLSDTTAKTSGFAVNILSSLSASFASGDPAGGLFANFLSEVQAPPPVPPNPPVNAQTDSSSSPQSSSQDTDTNAAADTTAVAANTSAPPSGLALTGKSPRHVTRTEPHKDKSQNQADGQSTPATSPVQGGSGATTANIDSTNDNGGTKISALNADLGQEANGQKSTTTSAVAGLAADASSSPSDPVSPNGGNDKSAEAGSGVTAAQSMSLLLQLERLAAGRLADGATPAGGADPANAAGAQGINTGAIQGTSGAAGKIDLKKLVTELVGEAGAGAAMTGQAGEASTGDNAQNTMAVPVSTTASLQNAASSSPTAANDKWMNASFLNLFNLATNNQNTTGVPFIFNPETTAGSATNGGDGAALDADAQNQNGTNARDAAIGVQTSDNNFPLTAGSSQAASPYDFASQLSAMRATKGGPTGLPTPVEQVVLQLSRGFSKDGVSQMTIQLRPAELGRVDVKLNIGGDGKVQGTVTADNPATLNLLLKDSRGLERALQEAGLSADSGSLQFNLRGDGQTGGGGGQTTNSQSGFANGAGTSSGSMSSLSIQAVPAETYYLTPGGVNMRV